MTRGPFPGAYGLAQIVARALGWTTAAATICILAFVINRWPDRGGAVAAGVVGAGISMLNDSWHVLSNVDRSLGFPRMSPARTLLHDLFALAVSLGGIVMVIFSRYTYGTGGFNVPTPIVGGTLSDDHINNSGSSSSSSSRDMVDGFSLFKMLAISIWILTAVVLWRFIFIVWGLFDCFREFRRVRFRIRPGMIERLA